MKDYERLKKYLIDALDGLASHSLDNPDIFHAITEIGSALEIIRVWAAEQNLEEQSIINDFIEDHDCHLSSEHGCPVCDAKYVD